MQCEGPGGMQAPPPDVQFIVPFTIFWMKQSSVLTWHAPARGTLWAQQLQVRLHARARRLGTGLRGRLWGAGPPQEPPPFAGDRSIDRRWNARGFPAGAGAARVQKGLRIGGGEMSIKPQGTNSRRPAAAGRPGRDRPAAGTPPWRAPCSTAPPAPSAPPARPGPRGNAINAAKALRRPRSSSR